MCQEGASARVEKSLKLGVEYLLPCKQGRSHASLRSDCAGEKCGLWVCGHKLQEQGATSKKPW